MLQTNLVARIDYDVCSTKKLSDSAGMRMEQALLGFGDSITAPIDLNEFGQFALK